MPRTGVADVQESLGSCCALGFWAHQNLDASLGLGLSLVAHKARICSDAFFATQENGFSNQPKRADQPLYSPHLSQL